MKSFVSPSKLTSEVNENVIFDEMVEEITEEEKSFIDIASDLQVLAEISKVRYLHYIFHLVKQKKYSLSNIAFLL